MSGDAYANKDGTSDAAGDPSFTVSIDGKQIGGTFSTVASESAGQTQSFLLNGTFGTGSHTVAVTFLNDAWGGSGSTDRNLYVNDLVYLGTDTKDSAALYSNGTQNFGVTGGTAPTPTPTPTPTPNPDDTVITTGGSKPITDGTGNLWNIVNGQVTLNGTTDTTTANVVKLAFVRGSIWDETASNVWQVQGDPDECVGAPWRNDDTAHQCSNFGEQPKTGRGCDNHAIRHRRWSDDRHNRAGDRDGDAGLRFGYNGVRCNADGQRHWRQRHLPGHPGRGDTKP